jgi:hypothetical protein
LIRRGLNPPPPAEISISPITGVPALHLGGPPITKADVDALEEEEDEYLMSFIRKPSDD